MVEFMVKSDILALKRQGFSNRKVAEMLKCNRKTVAKYWAEYTTLNEQLKQEKNRTRQLEIQQNMASIPQYDSSTRTCRTITPEIIETIGNILKDEKKKERLIGNNKQNLTVKQIHELLEEQGTYISLSSTYKIVQELKHKAAQCFIMQDYEYADRLEYDFGEFTVFIDNIKTHYYLAVMTSPASNYRWSYIYKTCGKDVFLESQIRFFHQIGGVWKEIVYDNMKNVVTKFIGRTEKLLNEDLIKLSTYYGFKINVTNCYSGNEKGSVENSVKYIRKQCFAKKYKFDTEDELFKYFNEQLRELNKDSKIDEERQELLRLPPKYEVATITTATVNTYSHIRIDNNFYSVPEYLVNKTVTVKIYSEHLIVYSNNMQVCTWRRILLKDTTNIDIKHYLHTFIRKTGALKNSLALKVLPNLKNIYLAYYDHDSESIRKFIQIIVDNKEKHINEIIRILHSEANKKILSIKIKNVVVKNALNTINNFNHLVVGGVK